MGWISVLWSLCSGSRYRIEPSRRSVDTAVQDEASPRKASSKEAPPNFKEQIVKGHVLPDELEGPHMIKRYHCNWRGGGRGFFYGHDGHEEWIETNTEKLKKWKSLATVDWDHPDAPDPDFALVYCHLAGLKLDMNELRPRIVEAQKEIVEVRRAALERAMAKPGAAAAFEKIEQLKERRKQEHQPGGRGLDIIGLFKGALGAICELWAYGLAVRKASGERDAELSWDIKKAMRIWFKLVNEYEGDVSCVTDCARISLEVRTAVGMLAAAEKLLERATTFKNRIANPTDEGYGDMVFTLPMSNGHICEVRAGRRASHIARPHPARLARTARPAPLAPHSDRASAAPSGLRRCSSTWSR